MSKIATTIKSTNGAACSVALKESAHPGLEHVAREYDVDVITLAESYN